MNSQRLNEIVFRFHRSAAWAVVRIAMLGLALQTLLFGSSLDVEKPFLVQVNPGQTRNDVNGFVGMVITVGAQPLTITALGRYRVAGNSGQHPLKVVRMSDTNDVPGTHVTVSMAEESGAVAPGDGGEEPFRYVRLPAPVTLEPHTLYFVVSGEMAGGDSWLDVERTTVLAREVASVDGAVFAFAGQPWVTGGLPTHTYGPVTFRYLGPPDPIPPTVLLTAPADGAVFDVPATVPIRAEASAGVTNVEFYAGGVRIGRDSSAPYGINWVNPAAGNHELTARALASNGGRSTSAVASVVVRQAIVGVEGSFVLDYEGGLLRNDFDGYIGMTITVGNNPLAITALGRFCFPSNGDRHRLKIVRATDGGDVPGSVGALLLAGCVPGEFAYVPLGRPVILSPATTYYVVSEESFDGDQWQDFDTTVSAANVAAVEQAVYGGVYFPWTQVGGRNRSFGPVNFKYLAEGGPALPTAQWVYPEADASFEQPANIVLEVATSGGVTNVEFFGNAASLGKAVASPFGIMWVEPMPGAYSLQAFATDTNGVTVATPPRKVRVGGTAVGEEVSFVQDVTPGLMRDDFDGFLGMEFTVGPAPITITRLGRMMVKGNTQAHLLKLVHAASGQDVPDGWTVVPMADGEPGRFVYAPLFFPITLGTNATYYLVSQEQEGGDTWYDVSRTTVTNTPVATVDGGVFGGPPWTVGGLPGHTYIPVSFFYLNEGSWLAVERVGGQVQLSLFGQPGRSYRVDATHDLRVWEEVGVYVVSGNPTTILDAQTGAFAARFYRALELAP